MAAVGPLSVAELQAAVAWTHTHRPSSAPSEQTLIEGMVLSGARHDGHSDRWSAPAGSVGWPRDRALLTAADPDTVYTRQQLTDLMIAAGYSARSAGKNTLDMHPLIQKLDRNRYRMSVLNGVGHFSLKLATCRVAFSVMLAKMATRPPGAGWSAVP
jgi:hypothetical protein